MKKMFASIMAGAAALALVAVFTPSAMADDNVQTITGNCVCGKCALHETAKCQNVVQVEKDGKTVNYYLAQNDISKNFHDNVCKGSEKVTATGTVKEVDGKMQMTPTKIEEAK